MDEQSKSATPEIGSPSAGKAVDATQKEVFNISTSEAIRRLRSKGEPIRLFGESDKERRLRLRALELIEERGEKVGQNDFMRALRGAESSIVNEELQGKKKESRKEGDGTKESESKAEKEADEGTKHREGVGMNSLLDLNLMKKDINKVYPIIYYTLKGLLRDWEQALAERPSEVRQSNQGKLVAATQVQSAEYLKPLFKQLRQRVSVVIVEICTSSTARLITLLCQSVLPDVLARLAEIVHYVQKREYRNANDSYLQLSIGNAPWPIGVTMVG
jgi:pre-mRNA-splicing factor 18